MPTTTALHAYNIFNLGTIDPSYSTLPEKCTTEMNFAVMAEGIPPPGTRSTLNNCEPRTYGDCIPGGASYDATVTSDMSAPARGFLMPYYSPASVCPDGWTTVGVAEKSGRDMASDVSVTGAFHATEFEIPRRTTSAPIYNPKPNVLLEAMGPGQTAVLCCPGGFTADPMGDCYQTLEVEQWPTVMCNVNGGGLMSRASYTYDGTRVWGRGYSVTDEGDVEYSTRSWTLRHTNVLSEVIATTTGYTYMPMLTLVDGEVTAGGGGGQETSGEGSSESTATVTETEGSTSTGESEAEESSPNAAPGGRIGGAGAGRLVMAWAVAAVVGAVLMAPL